MGSLNGNLRQTMGTVCLSMISGFIPANDDAGIKPNILWIYLDDARADVAGCYGKPWVNTPAIDKLAEEGVRFHNAIIQNPVCIPSRRSMKTGYYAHEVGPVGMGKPPENMGDYFDQEKMRGFDNSPVLLDAWSAIGMKPINIGKVHAFHDRFDLRGDPPRLFDVLGNPRNYLKDEFDGDAELLNKGKIVTKTHGWQIGGVVDIDPEFTETWRLGDLAVDMLDELKRREEPFFLRVSFHAPHVACYVPSEYFTDPSLIDMPTPGDDELCGKPAFERGPLKIYAGADLTSGQIDTCRATYYGMISLVDVQVGRILQALDEFGLTDNTIIAFTSDQGFQLGEHGLWKKRVFYEGNVRVPFILKYPDILPSGMTIEEPVEMIDFIPTLMEMSGLDVPREIRGASLLPLINGDVPAWREACFSEIDHSQSIYEELRKGSGRRVMVRTREWKLIFFMDSRVADKDGALYDLLNDPGERNNLYNDHAYQDVISYLEKLAEDWTNGKKFAPSFSN